ncbi:MAG: formate/nitrite transporter family protein, partial [Clostridia bacterium]|nr:formate/nitrite transporter family protein [Clostridia bacterium]
MFTPAEVAENVIGIGKAKAENKAYKLFLLGILAGMFIALAAAGANTAMSTVENPSLAKLVSALIFP